MDTISQQKSNLQALLTDNTSFGIIASEHQNIDVLAATLSLHLIFQDSGKNSQAISKKDPIVEHSFLVGIDQLKKSFGGTTKMLTVSFPYVDGEIAKVSYNIEGDKLNVNLFAADEGIKFEEKDIKYIRQGSSPQIIFTLGVQNAQEIEGLIDAGAKIVNIDNSVSNTQFGDTPLVDASYSSVSEIVARLATDLGLQVEFDVAQNLLDGISFATNNFTSLKTSPLAFEMAGVLMQKGAIRKPVKDTRAQSQDTSLSMLNKNQPKPFVQKSQPQQNMGQAPKQNFQPKQQFNDTFQDMPAQNTQDNQQPKRQNQQFQQDAYQPEPVAQPQSMPQTPQQYTDAVQDMQSNDMNSQMNSTATIPTEDEAPSDWFVPKVFKSTKTQE